MQGIAAFPQSAQPRLVDMPDVAGPGAGEVLCRTLQLGICGTDREILSSNAPMLPPGEEFLVLGHECLARVEAVGSGIERLSVGDLVVPTVRRGRPEATHRVDMQTFGEFTERGIVEQHGFSTQYWMEEPQYLLRVGPHLESVAVLAEPLSVAEKGINEALVVQQARLGPGTWIDPPPRVLVTGMGPIGFAAVVASRARGWPVTMYGRDPVDSFRARLAVELGAEYLPSAEADFAPADLDAQGYELILECTGSDALMVEASGLLASRGVLVWLGSSRHPQPSQHNVARMMRAGVLHNHVHIGSVNAAPRDFQDALAHLEQLLGTHPAQLEQLITARVSPEESLWHYEQRQPQGIKTVVMYE